MSDYSDSYGHVLRYAADSSDIAQMVKQMEPRDWRGGDRADHLKRQILADMLEDERHLPPDVRQVVERGVPDAGFSPLANPYGGDPVDAEKFVCPRDGNYVWWRVSVGIQVPTCRDHPNDVLVPATP